MDLSFVRQNISKVQLNLIKFTKGKIMESQVLEKEEVQVEEQELNQSKKSGKEEALKRISDLKERLEVASLYRSAESDLTLANDIKDAHAQGALLIDEDESLSGLQKAKLKARLKRQLDKLETARIRTERRNRKRRARAKRDTWFEIFLDKMDFLKVQIQRNMVFGIGLVIALGLSIVLHSGVFEELAIKMHLGNGLVIGIGLAMLMESAAVVLYLSFLHKTSVIMHILTLCVIAISGAEQYLSGNGDYVVFVRSVFGLIPWVFAIAISYKLQSDFLERYKVEFRHLPKKRKKALNGILRKAKKDEPDILKQYEKNKAEMAEIKPVNDELKQEYETKLAEEIRNSTDFLPSGFIMGEILEKDLSKAQLKYLRTLKRRLKPSYRQPTTPQPTKPLDLRQMSITYKIVESSLIAQMMMHGVYSDLLVANKPKKSPRKKTKAKEGKKAA